MNQYAEMAEFAENLYNNYIKYRLKDETSDVMSFYRATVTTNNNDGTLTIQRPFDTAYTVKCLNTLSAVTAGAQVLVLRFGNGNNNANHLAVAMGDGEMGVLQPSHGGTGLTSIDRLLKGEVSVSDLNGDADNAPYMSVIYVPNRETAETISHLPENSAGHLVTIGGTDGRGYQFYLIGGTNTPRIYTRKEHTSWSSWAKIVESEPSFTTPSVYSSRCTINSGGYYRIGMRVYVEVSVSPLAARNANTAYQYLSGLPDPSVARVPLACSSSTNKGGYTAVVTSSGGVAIINGENGIAVGDSLVIGGTYLASTL